MQANRTTLAALLSLVAGAGLYVVGVSGALWPATPPTDVGLVATSAVFVLFGVFGLMLGRAKAPA